MIYIGNTQQHLKDRMGQHFSEVQNLVKKGKGSDSFAKHFATHFKEDDKVARSDVREITKTEVLWQGNAISYMKLFGRLSCLLCMKERLEIIKMAKEEPENLINSRGEIYGACRHKTKFHRYMRQTTSTDNGVTQKELQSVTLGEKLKIGELT